MAGWGLQTGVAVWEGKRVAEGGWNDCCRSGNGKWFLWNEGRAENVRKRWPDTSFQGRCVCCSSICLLHFLRCCLSVVIGNLHVALSVCVGVPASNVARLWRHTDRSSAYNWDLHVVHIWSASKRVSSKWVYGMHVLKDRSQLHHRDFHEVLHHRVPARVQWICQAGMSRQKRICWIGCVLHHSTDGLLKRSRDFGSFIL